MKNGHTINVYWRILQQENNYQVAKILSTYTIKYQTWRKQRNTLAIIVKWQILNVITVLN